VTEPDAVMKRVGEGIELSQSGNREAARCLFSEVWAQIGGDRGDPFHRCALAHSMADVQDDVRDELLWDQRALQAADLLSDERAAAAGVTSPVVGFYPSLHLNLGECYRKLGNYDHARHHLEAGLTAVDTLPDDSYGHMITGGLERLAQRLRED
jgi:tetratricopeptide (TPR) repeat protein